MNHIKKFESFNIPNNKVNEEFDIGLLSSVPELLSQFIEWLKVTHYAGGEVVSNWQTLLGIVGALGLIGGGTLKSYLNHKKETLNKKIVDKLSEDPSRDPKEVAKEIMQELKN